MTPDPLEPRVLVGDVMERLADLPAESVHCVMTSPPYFGLRDYGAEGQIGLEPTLDEYVETMVRVFREVRRVLRPDGTVWLNLGDSYNTYAANRGVEGSTLQGRVQDEVMRPQVPAGAGLTEPALKAKDLMMVPARVALALQADGWWLRKEIVWAKPNAMPESTTDRPTSSHEKLYLLAKSSRYFYDADAIREKYQEGPGLTGGAYSPPGQPPHSNARGPDGRQVSRVVGAEGSIQHRDGERWPNGGRNKRDVWMIATESYTEAHFATFPTKLVEPCILAGTSEKGCCPECGSPWTRIVERESTWDERAKAGATRGNVAFDGNVGAGTQRGVHGDGVSHDLTPKRIETIGWEPSCSCGLAPTPCTVLDPFVGSGTTLVVARRLNRASVGVELNPEYAALAAKRLARWWEKPTKPRDEPVDGQISLLDTAGAA